MEGRGKVEGGGRGGWRICGSRTELSRTAPHNTEANRGKPIPDRTELHYIPLHYSTVQYSTVQCSTSHHITSHYIT